MLVEALDDVVQARKEVLHRSAVLKCEVVDELGGAVLGALDLIHGHITDITQLRQTVMDLQQVRLLSRGLVVLVQQVLKLPQALVEGLDVLAHLLHALEVLVRLGDDVDVGEVLDHVLGLGAQLVNLHHLLLDQVDGALAFGDAVHARLGKLQLLAQAMA